MSLKCTELNLTGICKILSGVGALLLGVGTLLIGIAAICRLETAVDEFVEGAKKYEEAAKTTEKTVQVKNTLRKNESTTNVRLGIAQLKQFKENENPETVSKAIAKIEGYSSEIIYYYPESREILSEIQEKAAGIVSEDSDKAKESQKSIRDLSNRFDRIVRDSLRHDLANFPAMLKKE